MMRSLLVRRHDQAWDRRVRRMVGVSTAAHLAVVALVVVAGAWLARERPRPMMAYSVELTDLPGTGGRLPAGPGHGVMGRGAPKPAPPAPAAPKAAEPPAPAAKAAEPPAPAKPEPPPAAEPPAAKEPEVKVAEAKKPEPKKPEVAKAEPAPEPKPEAKKAEPKTAEPPKPKAEPAKPAETPKQAEAKKPVETVKKTEPAGDAKPAATQKPAAAQATKPATGPGEAASKDAYDEAAKRFRDRMGAAAGVGAGAAGEGTAGGGPGGGVLGDGGDGRGGGRLVSLEYLAYRQRVITAVKERWANAITQSGLVARVRFAIAPDGNVSAIRLSQASGNPVYDRTALAAVERVGRLPPPPAAYANDFGEFEIEFHSEETGGMSG